MINYVKQKKVLTVEGEKQDRYMCKIYRNQDTSLDTIAKQIAEATTVSYPDVLAALKAFEINIVNAVMNGSAVKLGMLGSFIPAIHSKSTKKADNCDSDLIQRVTCRFFPSKHFRTNLKGVDFEYKDLSKIKHV